MIGPLRLFRLLILVDPCLSVLAALAGITISDSVPTGSEPEVLFMVLGSFALVLWVAALIGLWRLRIWARPLYVIATGLGLVLYLIPPYKPSSNLGDFFTGLTWIVTGSLLALMYYSPVGGHFTTSASQSR